MASRITLGRGARGGAYRVTVIGEPAQPGLTPRADRPDFEHLASGYVAGLQEILEHLDLDAVVRVVDRIRDVREAGGTVFIAGNGGSAATASHWVNDLSKATLRSGRRPIRVVGLVDNVSWITAIANDDGYDRVFSDQLHNLAGPGDLLVVITASGNSPNVLKAVATARAQGLTTVGFVGFDGGAVLDQVDDHVWIRTPKGEYGLVESAHTIACDIVTTCLIGDRSGEPDARPR
jgi:D-sedoheptulose 7-phosphate isomerase